MDQARGDSNGAIVERFIKPTSSTIFGHPGVTKFQSINVYVIPKNGMEVAEYCIIFNYGLPRSQNK